MKLKKPAVVGVASSAACASRYPPGGCMSDAINHPPHYTAGPIEVIDYIEQIVKQYPPEIGYHIGNALKYLSRAPLKGNMAQDLGKAVWYIERAASINASETGVQIAPSPSTLDGY
ncbi:DUF3310 domain-containing protein, partial [Streptomyces albidoflavus]|uniref:DUF3310 domain-containing protein n=1 Tax=Streptomyces albidoflavus TaxID=1886 RepID=UPI00342DE10F